MIPLGAVQFHAHAVAGLVALWPLAYHRWRPKIAHTARRHPAAAGTSATDQGRRRGVARARLGQEDH